MKYYPLLILIVVLVTGCKSSEPRIPIQKNSGSFIDESVERNRRMNEKEYAKIEAVLPKSSKHQVLSSQTGFRYYYNHKVGARVDLPEFGDLVTYEYNIKTLDETLLYSKTDIGIQTYYVDQQELFSGMREALKLMKPNETITCYFPSQKAYGYYGDQNRVGPNMPIICEISVKSITKQTQ